ncbi:MAG: hypothetical protein J5J00_13650 [Deltaproteobacteria bacterium]|nr:hypothetical protein [Deltaproteobacteria bacterium]
MPVRFFPVIIQILTILLLGQAAYALPRTCPITVEQNSQITELSLPGGIAIKLEEPWAKIQATGAFEEKEWTFARYDGGFARLTAHYRTSNGIRTVTDLYALKKDGRILWYVVSKIDPSSEKGAWLVASNAGGSYECEVISNSKMPGLSASEIGPAVVNWSRVEISNPHDVYTRMGL